MFLLNPETNHSECKKCGGTSAFNPRSTGLIRAFKTGYKRGMAHAKSEQENNEPRPAHKATNKHRCEVTDGTTGSA